MSHKLNNHQLKFLDKLLDAQSHEKPIKAVYEMQSAIVEFEKDIRKDQDKITRHDCAENVIKMQDTVIFGGSGGVSRNKAHSVIMNTNAIKED